MYLVRVLSERSYVTDIRYEHKKTDGDSVQIVFGRIAELTVRQRDVLNAQHQTQQFQHSFLACQFHGEQSYCGVNSFDVFQRIVA